MEGGWITIADSRSVAVVSVPASPWDGSPSIMADAAWGFVCAFHGSMVWHQFCQHIQVREGGGWIAIADSRTVAVASVPASPWDGSPSVVVDAAWASCGFHGSMVWHQFCQHIQVKAADGSGSIPSTGTPRHGHRFAVSLVSLFHLFQLFQLFHLFQLYR